MLSQIKKDLRKMHSLEYTGYSIPKDYLVVNSLMWACVGECLAHILRHKVCTKKLMSNVCSIPNFIRSVSSEVHAGFELPLTINHPCITKPTSLPIKLTTPFHTEKKLANDETNIQE